MAKNARRQPLSDEITIVFEDKRDKALIRQDGYTPMKADMTDVLVLVWAALRKGYLAQQMKKPSRTNPGVVMLVSRERIAELNAEMKVGAQT